jgi:small multidrug resistance pump
MWSGMGIVFIAVIGFAVFGQKLDLAAILGIGLIMAGILVINLFSGTATH